MSNSTMISTTSIQDLLTVRTKNFANKGMDYEQFVINLLFLLQTRWYVINEERTGTYFQILLVLLRISIFRIFFLPTIDIKKNSENIRACDIRKQNHINCWRCSMSVQIQQHLRRRLKYASVTNWNEMECIPGVPHYLVNNYE
jgi:hypothetical protein